MIAVELKGLTPEARRGLEGTLDALLEQDVAAGLAQVWELDAGSSYAITRLERGGLNELVICAYRGRDAEGFLELCLQGARAQGVRSIRFHTRRPGLARLIHRYRPDLAEYVYRVDVDGCLFPEMQTRARAA